MHIWQKRGLRTLFSAAFLLALLFGGASVPAANAGGIIAEDDFDPYPELNWTFEHNASSGAGGFEYINQGEYSSPGNAWLTATNGWSAMRHYLTIPSDAWPYKSCTAYVDIKSAVNNSVTVNLEVIDPSTWQYIAFKQVTMLKGGYRHVAVTWMSALDKVQVRFSLLSIDGYYKKARLDYFMVHCVDAY
jgi:hypothetical protein